MIDTDGIYDRCQCGEQAELIHAQGKICAVCWSCGAATRWYRSRLDVMLEWNGYQRNIGTAKKIAAGEK